MWTEIPEVLVVEEEVKEGLHCWRGSLKELECYWSVLWPGFTQLATCGLGRKAWFGGARQLGSECEWGNDLLSRELRSPGFGVFMISYHVTTVRIEVLESVLSGVHSHGRSWRKGQCFYSFLKMFKCTLKIGYAVLGSLEGIPSSLPHQKERGVLMCVWKAVLPL